MSEQAMQALAEANRVRLDMSELKGDVVWGRLTAVDALRDPRCHSIMVMTLLMAQERWGRQRSVGLLRALGIVEHRAVRDLTGRQLSMLEGALLWGKAPARKSGWDRAA